MTNLLTPLKKLGKKMTGQDISGTNLVTVVDDIANKYTGCGCSDGGEGGGEGDSGALVVNTEPIPDDEFGNMTLNKTWQEIHDAILSRDVIIVTHMIGEGRDFILVHRPEQVVYDSSLENAYLVIASDIVSETEYTTTTANGYPRTRFTEDPDIS